MAVPQRSVSQDILTMLNALMPANAAQFNMEFFQDNQENLAQKLIPHLKHIIIQHLSRSTALQARLFRGEDLNLSPNIALDYLEALAQGLNQPGFVEACAIGEALGINIVITTLYVERANKTNCIYLESRSAPNLHLYNRAPNCWFHHNPTTNSSTGLLEALCHAVQDLVIPAASNSALNKNSLFKHGAHETLQAHIRIKHAVEHAAANNESRVAKNIAGAIEHQRIQKLTSDEQHALGKGFSAMLNLANSVNAASENDAQEKPSATFEM